MLLFCHIHFQPWDSTCSLTLCFFFTLNLIAITPSTLKLGAGATDSESLSHNLQELFIDYFSQVWTDARRISWRGRQKWLSLYSLSCWESLQAFLVQAFHESFVSDIICGVWPWLYQSFPWWLETRSGWGMRAAFWVSAISCEQEFSMAFTPDVSSGTVKRREDPLEDNKRTIRGQLEDNNRTTIGQL